jgi:hypothetical protein
MACGEVRVLHGFTSLSTESRKSSLCPRVGRHGA